MTRLAIVFKHVLSALAGILSTAIAGEELYLHAMRVVNGEHNRSIGILMTEIQKHCGHLH